MSNLTAIDLSQLDPPDVIHQIDFETILSDALNDFYQRIEKVQPNFQRFSESDPAMKLAEVFAYREVIIRQESNQQAQSVLLAYATKADLDHKAAERNLKRHLISPATATSEAVWETDPSLRRRVQLAPEGYSTAGSEGSYIFHGLNADAMVKDIYPFAPVDENGGKGICNIYVLSHDGNGFASEELQHKVMLALNKKNIRPTTDFVKVFSASVISYTVEAKLQIEDGPDSSLILETATEKLKKYVQDAHAFGDGPALSGMMAALHQPGVTKVIMITPTGDIETSTGQVAFCTNVKVTIKGDDNE